jgi:hypothetical protein
MTNVLPVWLKIVRRGALCNSKNLLKIITYELKKKTSESPKISERKNKPSSIRRKREKVFKINKISSSRMKKFLKRIRSQSVTKFLNRLTRLPYLSVKTA